MQGMTNINVSVATSTVLTPNLTFRVYKEPVLSLQSCVLAFGIQVRGFKPDRSRWTFQGEKILSTPSFGREVKPSVPCRRFTACKRSLNVSGSRVFSGKIHLPFLAHVVPHLAARISWGRLEAKVGTFKNKKAHKHLHLWPLGPHRRRLAVRSGTSKGSTISQYGCNTFRALATEAQ